MMRRAIGLITTLALLSVFAVVDSHAQQDDYLIVPGQRVGPWELGKTLDSYGFGQPVGRSEGRQDGKPYLDNYAFIAPKGRVALRAYTCRNDGLVFALEPWRRVDQPSETEAVKYKTAEGIGIGASEDDVQKLLGRPQDVGEWDARHGTTDLRVKALTYPGLRILLNKSDQKVFAVAATTRGGFAACLEAVLGKPGSAQAPAPSPPTALPRLPVPMPPDLRIAGPTTDLPADRAAFLGIWVGRWNNTQDTALAVEEISGSTARIVFAWGVVSEWNVNRAGWIRGSGRFSGRTLYVQPMSGASQISYTLVSESRIDAFWPGPPVDLRTTMTKVR